MDRLVGPKVIQLCWLLFMVQRLEPERVRTLRKPLLKSFGSPKLGRLEKWKKEYEMILKRTLQSICLLTIHPNTTSSIILQVVGDDGALLPCAINASCAALVNAGIPLKHLSVAICCGLTDSGSVILDPTKAEEEKMQAFAYLVFPSSPLSVLPKASSPVDDERGIITPVTHGLMSDGYYISCPEHGHAACAKISEFLRKSLHTQFRGDLSKGVEPHLDYSYNKKLRSSHSR